MWRTGSARKNDSFSLWSRISLALGSMENAPAEVKKTWEPVLSDWYRNQPSNGVHSAAGWALRTWRLILPTIDTDVSRPADFQWRVTKKGLTMLRIPAGEVHAPKDDKAYAEPKTIRIADEFWLSDCEVTAGLFAEFLHDPEAEKPLPD